MVKDHSDSEKRNLLPPHRLLFPIKQQGFFYMHHPTDRTAHTTTFVTPVVEHWLEQEIAQWVHPMKDRSDDPLHHEQTLLPWSLHALKFYTKAAIVVHSWQWDFHEYLILRSNIFVTREIKIIKYIYIDAGGSKLMCALTRDQQYTFFSP